MPALLRMLANLALGGFFVASAGFKLVSPALFVEQIAAFGLIATILGGRRFRAESVPVAQIR